MACVRGCREGPGEEQGAGSGVAPTGGSTGGEGHREGEGGRAHCGRASPSQAELDLRSILTPMEQRQQKGAHREQGGPRSGTLQPANGRPQA